jgi:hypothetical protein
MARLARVIAVDVPHHVTQRGNARRFILDSDSDRAGWPILPILVLPHVSKLWVPHSRAVFARGWGKDDAEDSAFDDAVRETIDPQRTPVSQKTQAIMPRHA